MPEPPDPGGGPRPAEQVSTTVREHGVTVEKVAATYREGSVAVTVTVRSAADGRAEVRVTDPLPDPFRKATVEFHPEYDRAGWSHADGSVVYEGPIGPGERRTMLYGVAVDDPGQVEVFDAPPAVEVADAGDIFSYWSGDEPMDAGAPARAAPPGSGAPATPTGPGAGDAPVPADERSMVEAFLYEVQRRDLSAAEKRALRQAIDLDGATDVDRRLESLRDTVQTLRAAVAATEQATADLDRLDSRVEALAADVDDRFRSLSADLEAVRDEVERGSRWRATVEEAIVFDPRRE